MEADQNINIFADGTFRMRLDNLLNCRARIQLLASHNEWKVVFNSKGDRTELISVLALFLATAMLILTSNSFVQPCARRCFCGEAAN